MTDLKAQEKLTNSKGWKFVKNYAKEKKGGIMAWNYIKQKPVPTPDANKNNKPVKASGDKKDTNSVTGTRAARPQKPVTWT